MTAAETPKYARKQIDNASIMDIGMDLLGFLASSPAVAMTSKPTKAKNAVADPARTPEGP